MLPSEYCEDCGAVLSERDRLQYLDVCRDCYETWAAYLAQLVPPEEAA